MAYLMVADTDRCFASAAAEALREAGHEVAILADLSAAIHATTGRRPDLLILDASFPAAGAVHVEPAHTMRDIPWREIHGVPLLVLTSLTDGPLPWFRSGGALDWALPVTGFLQKPVAPDRLRLRVAGLLSELEFQVSRRADRLGKGTQRRRLHALLA